MKNHKGSPISWIEGIMLLIVGLGCALASILFSFSLTTLFLNQTFLWNLIQLAGVIAGFGLLAFQINPKKITFFHTEFKKDLSSVTTFSIIAIFLSFASMPFLKYPIGTIYYFALLLLTDFALLSFLYALILLLVSVIYYSKRLPLEENS